MAITLTATVGSASANSYSTLAEANTYHDGHPYGSVWDTAAGGTDQKNRALITATKLLDTWFTWKGSVVGSTQALLWPRVAAVGPNGYEEPSDDIPTRIKDATAELARQLLAEDRTADNEAEVKGLKRMKVGSIEMEFTGMNSKPIPDAVSALVLPYVLHSNKFPPIILRRA